MRRRARLLAVLAALATVLVPASPAASAPTVITFEEFSRARTGRSFDGVTTQYSARGINFTDPSSTGGETAVDYGPDSVYAQPGFSTRPGGVVGIVECFAVEFACPDPIDFSFTAGQHRVRVWVGLDYPWDTSKTVALEAFDGGGRLVGEQRVTFPAGPRRPVNTPLEVVLGANIITSARVRFVNPDGSTGDTYTLVVDDVEFERGTPDLLLAPDPVDFGDAVVDDETVDRTAVVTSVGPVAATVRSVRVTGAQATEFTVTTDGCTGRTLAPKAQCSIGLRFDPGGTGTRAATLEVTSSAPDTPDVSRLAGTGRSRPAVTTPSSTTPADEPDDPTETTADTIDDEDGTTTVPVTTTSTTIPATTPGAALTVDPPLSRTANVVRARGSGFEPGAVTLRWAPGVGVTQAVAGADGNFEAQVLVFGGDVLGPRTLIASSPTTTATAAFLVVPNTMRPAGTDAVQVARFRRFLHR